MLYDSLRVELFEPIGGRVEGGDLVGYDLPDFATFVPKLKRSIYKFAPRMPLLHSSCPFCGAAIRGRTHTLRAGGSSDVDDSGGDALAIDDDPDWRAGALEVCPRCTYWRWHHVASTFYGTQGLMAAYEYRSEAGKLAEYSVDVPAGCIEELAVQLRRHPRLWHSMTPQRLETLVADVVRANFKAVDVQHVGGTNDGGVDVVCIESDSKRWLIQVKGRSSSTASEGVDTIRNLLGAMVLKRSQFGAVVSTANHFTHMAHEAVGTAAKVGSTIRIVDRHMLDRLLTPLLPSEPWAGLLSSEYPEFARHFVRPEPVDNKSDVQLDLFPATGRRGAYSRLPGLGDVYHRRFRA